MYVKQLLALANLEVLHIEPYWKINGYFQVELEGRNPTIEELSELLKDIPKKWVTLPDSIRIIMIIEGCTMLLANLEFIEISPDD
ncbi:hypothetical protein [Peribacillus kribbensis]|uniref:hypothetical protein n=1 Tax=Peribacillus kribbensis TaxID=356658 RepID=UPI00041CE9D2|nr:hypothetical protein [Peribacillus kribbensis]